MSFSRTVFLFAGALLAHAALGRDASPEAGASPPQVDLAQASDAVPRTPLKELLARADGLSRSGRNAEAYELLAAAEDSHIGAIGFDYALGRAALDAGRPDKATLAFARVLALEPEHAGARIDLGRAYLALGDSARAQATFRALLASDPPPEIRAQLLAFLDLADSSAGVALASGGVTAQGYLAAVAGRSSNVNQSPSQSSIFVPALGSDFQLADQNVRKPDSFAGIMGGVDFSQPLDGTYTLAFGGEFLERRNFHEFAFDLAGVNLYVGLAAVMGQHAWRIQRQAGRDYLGGSPSRDLDALAFNYVGLIGDPTQILVSAQGGRLRHVPEGIRIFDANYVTLGAGASHRIDERSTVFAMFLTGNQNDVGGSPSGDKRALGLRTGAETAVGSRVKLAGTVAAERGRYDGFDTGFQTERRDLRFAYEAGIQYALQAGLSLRFSVSHVDQRSNIPIYKFGRSEWSLMLRRDFP
ncbi:MAG: tetratricopeptide repeat protein [Burkholderiales bacterium]